MTKFEAKIWWMALMDTALELKAEGDLDGMEFSDELACLLEEFFEDTPIQRKPY